MGRSVLLILCLPFLAAAAPRALRVDYTRDELAELSDRMAPCLDRTVRWASDDVYAMETVGEDCRHFGEYYLGTGVPKENITDLIVGCLKERGANLEDVPAARQCLAASLAQDLGMDKIPYSEYQIALMDLRLMKCLDAVPDAPSVLSDCRYSAGLDLLRAGVQRRDLPPRVTACLSDHGVDAARAEDAKQCLSEALAWDLDNDVGPNLYTDDQMEELGGRLTVCLNKVPGSYQADCPGLRGCYVMPGEECRISAGIYGLADGDTKEELPDKIASCLDSAGVQRTDVAKARQCLSESLAKDFTQDNF